MPFSLSSRVIVLASAVDAKIQIKEYCHGNIVDNGDLYTIEVGPRGRREVAATKFRQRAADSGRPRVLMVFVNGVDTGATLVPRDFIDFVKIIFQVNPNRQLLVTGVRAKWSDLCRLSGLGFLGRKYEGRPEELIYQADMPNIFNV